MHSNKTILPVLLLLLVTFSECNAMNNTKMDKIKVGDNVPEFRLKDQNGDWFDIQSVLGRKNLVIYFYPKDDSPGCTRQACAFRDKFEDFNDADAMVIGISGQSVESHKKFAEKYNLSFTLLSDENNRIRKLFGVPSDLFGLIPGRVTYVVNKKGKVVYLFNSQSKVNQHVEKSLSILNNTHQ